MAAAAHRAVAPATPVADDDPEGCCYRMLSAQRAGDVQAYLDCFTGELRQLRTEQLQRKSAEAQSAELRERALALTGQVTRDLQLSEPNRATLVLERVFTQHSERQQVALRLTDGGWKISSVQDLGRIESRIPYGTPVSQPGARQPTGKQTGSEGNQID